MVKKQCVQCKQVLPVQDFCQSEFTPDGYVDSCWRCRQAESRKTGIRVRSWAKENPVKSANASRLYYIKQQLWTDARCDSSITIETLYERDKGICGICKQQVETTHMTIDHIIPLSVGGSHVWNNIQLAHKCCNSAKKNKYDRFTDSSDPNE